MSKSVTANEKIYPEDESKLEFELVCQDEHILLDETGHGNVDVVFSLVSGDSLELYSSEENNLRVGARSYYINEDGQKEYLGDFRAESEKVIAVRGHSLYFQIPLYVDPKNHFDLFICIDLVREEKYWFDAIEYGFSIELTLEPRLILNSSSVSMSSRKFKSTNERDRLAIEREKRSEVIIFSLLDSLKKLSSSRD